MAKRCRVGGDVLRDQPKHRPARCLLRGGVCFLIDFQNAGASFGAYVFNNFRGKTGIVETHLDFLRETHTNMRLTCDDNGETLNLPQEAYNTTMQPATPGIPDSTTHIEWADYQLVAKCYVFQPQTVTGWLDGVGVATAALGALTGFYSQLDWLCSIGKPESASNAAATRTKLGVVLIVASLGVFVVFIVVALAFNFDALPSPNLAEIYTALVTAGFLFQCKQYISKYAAMPCDDDDDDDECKGSGDRVDPWANLEKLFEAHSDDGLWTPKSTAALKGYREIHRNCGGQDHGSQAYDRDTGKLVYLTGKDRMTQSMGKDMLPFRSFASLMELSGKELADPDASHWKSIQPHLDEKTTDALNDIFDRQCELLAFIAAIKNIPVQAGPYASKRERAGHFTIEEVWNASWETCFFHAYQFGACESGIAETHSESDESEGSDIDDMQI